MDAWWIYDEEEQIIFSRESLRLIVPVPPCFVAAWYSANLNTENLNKLVFYLARRIRS